HHARHRGPMPAPHLRVLPERRLRSPRLQPFVFCKETAPTDTYTLSLHDALPIWMRQPVMREPQGREPGVARRAHLRHHLRDTLRSEEHTSELQSLAYLVCRLLLEKKKDKRCGQITILVRHVRIVGETRGHDHRRA